jgi:hypothetical protein
LVVSEGRLAINPMCKLKDFCKKDLSQNAGDYNVGMA